METAIEADVEVLQLFGPVQRPAARAKGFELQVERLFQTVAARVQKSPEDLDRYRPVLEFVSREEPTGWRLLGQLLEEQQPSATWAEDAANAYRAYLDSTPSDDRAWRSLARVAQAQGDYLGSTQALIERARLRHATFADVSYAATRVNSCLRDGLLQLDSDEKRILLTSLVDVVLARRDEADATDLSRLAWLLINLGRTREAKDVVQDGVELDPANSHCLNLASRLHVALPTT